MADEATNRDAFLIQRHYCDLNAAPIYGRICAALAHGLTRDTRVGARVLDWPGEPTRDALPLRLIGGLHALVLAEADAGLAAVFLGAVVEQDAIAATLARVRRARGGAAAVARRPAADQRTRPLGRADDRADRDRASLRA